MRRTVAMNLSAKAKGAREVERPDRRAPVFGAATALGEVERLDPKALVFWGSDGIQRVGVNALHLGRR